MAFKNSSLRSMERLTPPGRSRAPKIILVCLILLVSPLAYEGGLICYGNWRSMMGAHYSARTPVLDAISEVWRDVRSETSRRMQPMMFAGRWSPAMAVPLALAIAGLGTVLLRKGH
jgi:uncharacterized membrane protein